jgi:hypothetical protein
MVVDEQGSEGAPSMGKSRFHQLMNEPGRREEGDWEAAPASGQAERQTGMRLAGAGITQSNDIVPGGEIFAAGEFENERLVERRDSGEVECIETLYCWKMRAANAAFDHAPFAIDEFEVYGSPHVEDLALP